MDALSSCHQIIRTALIVLGMGLVSFPASAQVYQFVDAEGTIYFSNVPTDSRYRLRTAASRRVSSPVQRSMRVRPEGYKESIKSASVKYNVDPKLIDAVIRTESSYDPWAVSEKGAMGLMQLMPKTASFLNVEDPFDPQSNIEGGVRYLRYLLNLFDGDLKLAVAAYHAGETRVQRYNGIPPIETTRAYVRKVLGLYGDGDAKPAPKPLYRVQMGDQVIYTNRPESYPMGRPTLISYNR
jgi:soluble lytic murein transglycosylase-like protein